MERRWINTVLCSLSKPKCCGSLLFVNTTHTCNGLFPVIVPWVWLMVFRAPGVCGGLGSMTMGVSLGLIYFVDRMILMFIVLSYNIKYP